ncbi:MAG TPA: tetratricopeptide repeat protein [Bacteroidales bacterium]|nr:tetratricopeptide repeat protein [Bacteroidales bacterium]
MKKTVILVSLFLFAGLIYGQKTVDYLFKAKAFVKAGKPDDAVAILAEAISLKQESRLYIERAEAYISKGDYSQAINDLNLANNMKPLSGEYGLSRIYALRGDAATALYHLELNLNSPFKISEKEVMLDPAFSVIENRPEWRQFWKKERYGSYEKAISEVEYYVSKGDIEEAKSILADLKRNYPDKDGNLYATALISLKMASFSEAVKTINGLVVKYPDDEKYLRILARAQEGAANPAGASNTYTRLLELEVPDAEVLVLRAECYRKTGETAKALSDIEKYLDLYPYDKKSISLAGKVVAASGDNLKALDYFSRNLKLYPNDAECYIDRANAYFVSRSWDVAIKDYSMALDLQPGNADVWLNKGIALLNSGKTTDACYDFRKSFSMGNKKATEYISRNCIK